MIKFTKYDDCMSERVDNNMIRAGYIAAQGTCKQKHGAVLMQGSRVLAVGVNSFRNEHKNLTKNGDSKPSGITLHAEVAVTKNHLTVPNTTLYIVRINKSSTIGNYMDSRPCRDCVEHLLWNTSVKEVVYS